MYTARQELQFGDPRTRIVAVKTNGGSLAIKKLVGTDEIVANTITTDGAYPLQLGTTNTIFEPTGGCAYEVEQ